jgi:hypothetical protein
MSRREESAVWKHAAEIQSMIELWLRVRDGQDVPLRYSREDQVRLLKYRTWMFRYLLSVQEILDMTIPVLRGIAWRRQVKKKRRRGLGISVTTLTGIGTERILKEQLQKAYPDAEHVSVWRERERDRQMAVERREKLGGMPEAMEKRLKIIDYETPEAFVQHYERRLQRARQDEMEAVNPKRRKRYYRWNPFL